MANQEPTFDVWQNYYSGSFRNPKVHQERIGTGLRLGELVGPPFELAERILETRRRGKHIVGCNNRAEGFYVELCEEVSSG